MGTQSSHYCYCNKVITLNKDILLTSSTEPIIKLNRIFVKECLMERICVKDMGNYI